MENDEMIEFRKSMSQYKKTGLITECFHHKKEECKGKIKQAHSLQRNGRLSIIEGEVNGQMSVYSFTDYESDETTLIKTLKPIGKAIASTFFGFCDYHDTSLFSPIENYKFVDNDKNCFLHSYRSFAHSYHRKKEQLKAFKTSSDYTKIFDECQLAAMIKGAEIAVKEGEYYKEKLDVLIENEAYGELEYLTYIIPYKIPIACSTVIQPYYIYKGTPINNHIDENIMYSSLMMTILPDHGQTIVILACFNDDAKSITFLDELSKLPFLKLEKAISALLITVENVFLAPALWNSLSLKEQTELCNEIMNDMIPESFQIKKSFPKSKFNFFEKKFSAEKLII